MKYFKGYLQNQSLTLANMMKEWKRLKNQMRNGFIYNMTAPSTLPPKLSHRNFQCAKRVYGFF